MIKKITFLGVLSNLYLIFIYKKTFQNKSLTNLNKNNFLIRKFYCNNLK